MTHRARRGRVKPYTAIGISRVPCLRCGKPSAHQWNICSLGNRFYGLCPACDIALNALVLRFMHVPDAAAILARYRARLTNPSAREMTGA